MKNLWNEQQANLLKNYLEERVYTSRLLGMDASLVLHGGGNTSVKGTFKTIFGQEEETLYVKGSGSDLISIEQKDFVPVKLNTLIELARLETLSDSEMARELKLATLVSQAPAPSVEAILHAVIPYRFVDHTHADAILALTNSQDGEARIRDLFGDEVIIIPYIMPGFYLGKVCAELFHQHATNRTQGMILMNHGIFTFGDSAKQSYERMINLVDRADNYLTKISMGYPSVPHTSLNKQSYAGIPLLRKKISEAARFPVLIASKTDERTLHFANHPDLTSISQRGPATPDHIIRTKRLPLLGEDVAAYSEAYQQYFEQHAPQSKIPLTMLDPAPRVIINPEIGLQTVGRSAKECKIAADIYSHTIDIILQSEALGGYRALDESDLFQMEYWELEQAKLKLLGAPKPFAGEVVLITGAASGIGKACVESFLSRGAAVVGIDINPSIENAYQREDFLGIAADLTSLDAINTSMDKIIQHYGGLDMLVLNAGVFPGGKKIETISDEEWHRVMTINLDANLKILRSSYPLLKLAIRGGRVAVIGSKNVAAPGPGAVAYSASKAALTQMARVAALEWGQDNIRINMLHPNAVFDTGIWTEEVLTQRAAHYGMSVDEYKRNNLLKTEITSKDVAELAAELCGPLFSKITGAQIPIDGGNERVI